MGAATWDASGENLLLPDPFLETIQRVSIDGRSASLERRFTGSINNLSPVALKETERGILVQLRSGNYVEVTESGLRLGAVTLSAGRRNEGVGADRKARQLQKVWQWTLAQAPANSKSTSSREDFVAFAEVFNGGEFDNEANWTFGVVRYPLNSPQQFQVLERRDPESEVQPAKIGVFSPARTAFRLDYPLIAAVGETAYILFLEEKPTMYAAPPGARFLRPVKGLPSLPGLERSPDLGYGDFASDYDAIMERLSQTETYGGLYAFGGVLYYLSRKPNSQADPGSSTKGVQDGFTEWSLTALMPDQEDPTRLRMAGTTTSIQGLSADQLTVVPGPNHWAFIEKGNPGQLYRDQRIPGMYLVPTEQIEDITSGGSICGSSKALEVASSP